jgi:pyrophosphatase PpaX
MAVLFDLDGTLVDTVPFILAGVRHAFQGTPWTPSDAEWIAGIGTPIRRQLGALVPSPEHVEPVLERYRAFWRANHDRMTALFPGVGEAVRALRAAGHPLGVVTAKVASGAERTLRHVGLWEAFQVVVGADTVARCKPDPEPIQYALERLGRAPGQAVMIGDSNHDLAAGRAAGTITAGVLWGAAGREVLAPLADHLLEEVGELLPLVARLQAEQPGERRP